MLVAGVGSMLAALILLLAIARRSVGGAAAVSAAPEQVGRAAPAPSDEFWRRATPPPTPRAPEVAAPPVASSVSTDRVIVRTVDRHGARAREVELYETTESGARPIGSSGPDGQVELDFPRRAWTALVARRADLGSTRVSWREVAPREVELRLGESESLAGRVLFESGAPAPAGMTVLAVPTRLARWAMGLGLEQLADNPEFGRTQSSADGAFRIEGLNRGERYALHCGGRGCVAIDGQLSVEPGDERIELRVARCYGVLLEFVDVSGASACVPEVFGTRGSFDMSIHDANAEFVLNLPPSARLALGPIDSISPAPTSQLILLRSARDLSELGPIEYRCWLPGYSAVLAECFALPVDNGVARHEQPIVRDAADFGAFQLLAEPAGALLQRSAGRHGPIATLELTPAGRSGTSVRVLRADRADPWRFECVPFGSHEVVFVSQPETEHSRLSLGAITIGPQSAQLPLPTRRLGALTLHVQLDDGREYAGELVAGLGSLSAPGTPANTPIVGATTVFRHAPYEFALLPPGEYRVWISEPGLGSAPADVRVAPGESTQVALRVLR